jgi:16S rRNA (guanine966-N2)-methyltransferase
MVMMRSYSTKACSVRDSGKQTTRAGSVRIIGGIWRRRKIPVPAAGALRPTPDRVRETLFNWLDPVLPGAACLDLYAGTGALGLEALSRGAGRCTFVERDPQAAAALERICKELDAGATVVRDAAEAYVRRSERCDADVVFVDPPYRDPVGPILAALLAELRPGALVYLERDRHAEWPSLDGLVWTRRKTAGAVAFGLGSIEPGPCE